MRGSNVTSHGGSLSPRKVWYLPDVTWPHPFLDIFLHVVPLEVRSVLDIGCGRGIVGALIRIYREPERIIGVDAFEPYISFCRETGQYTDLLNLDVRKTSLPFNEGEFDLATALEVIEHLPRADGVRLLDELERVSKMVVVSTPNRYFRQSSYDDNPFQQHLSRWTVRDFVRRGYSVYGAGGFLFFGRELGLLSYALSRITIPLPHLSGTILCAYSRKSQLERVTSPK